MTKIVQIHRMSTAQAGLYTGPAGEVIVDTGSNRLLVQDGLTPGGFATCMASLNLADLADATVSRTNLGAAPLANPNFTGGAQVNGDTVCTLLAAQTLVNKQLTSPTMVTPVLGTPASGNLTNCTGYDAVDLAGLGANVATFLTTPTSANLRAAITDETGTGPAVFGTSPVITGSPNLGGKKIVYNGATPFNGGLGQDTGVNCGGIAFAQGVLLMAYCQAQNGAGNSTQAAIYMIRVGLNGSTFMSVTQIALDLGTSGLGAWTFGATGGGNINITPPGNVNTWVVLEQMTG